MDGGGGWNYQYADSTVKTGCIEYVSTNAATPFAVDSNRFNGGTTQMVRRYNRAIMRWPANWPFNKILFQICCPVNVNSDMRFPIFQGGVQIGLVTGTSAMKRKWFSFPVTPNGGPIEVWEPWTGKDGAQNQGADGAIAGGYITGVAAPTGYALKPATCNHAVVIVGESIIGAVVSNSATFGNNEVFGVAGQLRLLAATQGKIIVNLDYGGQTLRGDGVSVAQHIALIQAAVASVGASAATVHFNTIRNDWANFGSSVSSTPGQCAADLQSIIDGLPGYYRKVVATPIPQTDETDKGGGTLPAYRAPILTLKRCLVVDSTTIGLVAATHTGDGVHMNAAGVAIYTGAYKGPILGL